MMYIEFLKSKGPSAISRVLGVSRPTASNYCNGKTSITVDQAEKLAKHYNVHLSVVIDPSWAKYIAELEEQNSQLTAKFNAIKTLVQKTCHEVENIATGSYQ